MQKIIVTGANGQLGQELRELSFNYTNYEFIFFSRNDLDITDAHKVAEVIQALKPAYLINCAAYTAVDKAETESEAAFAINATGAKNLASACKQYSVKFIHISTDYVFDGKGNEPYTEEAETNPLSIYGKSKLEGEKEVMKENEDAIIIRTSWVYSYYGNNFVKTMIRLMSSREQLGVVSDQYGSPTYAADIATAIMQIIDEKTWHPGVYHYTNDGVITWFHFAKAIKELTGSNCDVTAITTKDYPTPAARPHYCVLSKENIVNSFGIALKPWKESLQQCIDRLTKEA